MRKIAGTHSIKSRLLLLYVMMTVSLLAVMILFVRQYLYDTVARDNQDFYTLALSQTAMSINDQLDNYRKICVVVTGDYTLRTRLRDIVEAPAQYNINVSKIKWAVLNTPNKDLFSNIYVYPRDGAPINCYYERAIFEEETWPGELMDNAEKGGEDSVYTVLGSEPYCISLLNVVWDKGEAVGVVRFDLKPDFLTAIFGQTPESESNRVLMLDDDSRVIFSRESELLFTRFDYETLDASYITADLPAPGWVFVAALPMEHMQSTMDRFVLLLGILILLVMLVVGLYSILCLSALLKPMKRIIAGMERVTEGDLETDIGLSPLAEYNVIITSFHQMVRKIKDLLETVYYQQTYLRRAQMNELQSKFNPHFLYNTLDMIYWQLVGKGDDDTAEMVVALSDLLRYSITHDHEFTVLREEERQIEHYLMLQSKRLGDSFHWDMHFEEDILDLKTPCLLLQPLVENAVKHAFTGQSENKHIGVSGYVRDGRLILMVTDNGVGMSAEKARQLLSQDKDDEEGTSLGIGLVHKRLQYIYGEEYGIQIYSEPNKGCVVQVMLGFDRAGKEPERFLSTVKHGG